MLTTFAYPGIAAQTEQVACCAAKVKRAGAAMAFTNSAGVEEGGPGVW